MKLKNIVFSLFTGLLTLYSCEVIENPVKTCTFSETPNNADNPNNALYNEILDEYVALGIPGLSVAINTPEHKWWVSCAGMARIEDKVAMKPCHLLNSGSIAKAYTATLIMRLYEENKLDINDPIREYLPVEIVNNVANVDVATIHQLLSHTSGISMRVGISEDVDGYNDPFADSIMMPYLEKYLYGTPALADPGEKFSYNNANYFLLAFIIENVSEMSFSEYFDQEIREPVGLVNTDYISDPGYPDDIENDVNYYMEAFPGELQNCTDILDVSEKTAFGAYGMYATAFEYARFFQELMRGHILDSTTLKMMLADEKPMNDVNKYCMGITKFEVDDRISYGHVGRSLGSNGIVIYFPESDATISILANLGGSTFFDTSLIPDIVNVTFTGSRE